ncbi:hypothetical protein HF086_018125 [Spodoptera exigua]|uniref:Pre-C2HC domain-containing protein n=1 Tax=Spodoptera exigua TaxID=7107 RepID=A0A922SKF0_SPOEX|nr:hypothetical protein HF086_018125 [Spodoptera exigua]
MTKKKSKQKGKVDKLAKELERFSISEPGTSQSSSTTSAAPSPSKARTTSVTQAVASTSAAVVPAPAPATPASTSKTAAVASTSAAATASTSEAAATASPTSPALQTGETILDTNIKPQVQAKWPKVKNKVPPVFLHKPVDFEQHVKKVLNMGIKFYQPNLGKNYTKIICESFNDHKHLTKYFEKKQLPYHTFGHPSKRKMKVVIRGLPKDVELYRVKSALKSVSIPVIRVHKMNTKEERKDNTILVLAVVPYDESGKVILKLSKLLGHKIYYE